MSDDTGRVATLLSVESEIANIMKDLRGRINQVLEKYSEPWKRIPKLPDYTELADDKLRYELSRKLTESIDELLSLKVRINLVSQSLNEYKDYQPSSKAETLTAQRFRASMRNYVDELDACRFDLMDLVKNANNKLRILESVQFYNA